MNSKTLYDVMAYATRKGMSEVETDGKGNVLDYDRVCFGINCEMEGGEVFSKHDFGCDIITIKAKYIANVTKELDGKFFSGTEMRIKRITCFVQKNATTGEEFNVILNVAFSHQAKEEKLIGVEVVTE